MYTLNTTGNEIYNLNMVRGDGCLVTDMEGSSFADMESGVWALPLGHNHSRITNVIIDQLTRLSHVGFRYSTPIVEEASKALLSVAGLEEGRCVFLCSGSEAVEFALKAAKSTMEKPMMLKLNRYYLAAYGLSNEEEKWVSVDWQKESETDKLLEKIPFETIGAFVFEPGNASGTVQLPPYDLIQKIVSKVRSNGGWVVADEVTTGIGRTGKWFGYEHYDVKPDIIACGKGLGNGYPVSAAVLSKEVCAKLKTAGLLYAQSHQNDPLGCAVAKVVIETVKEEHLIERSARKGSLLKEMLLKLSIKHPCIREVRGIGLMCAVEFSDRIDAADLLDLHRKLYKAGFITGLKPAANIVRFYPPLIIEDQMINELIEAMDKILDGRPFRGQEGHRT